MPELLQVVALPEGGVAGPAKREIAAGTIIALMSERNQMSDTKINTMTVNGEEYVRVASLPATPAGPPTPHRIVVADRGFVFVGATTQNDDGSLTIMDAKCLRVWGTDSSKPGLGWLAQHGPTDKTKMDSSGTVRIPSAAVVLTFDTDAARWSK